MKKQPVVKQDTPAQLEIRRLLYSLPFTGGTYFKKADPGEMTWEDMAYNLQQIHDRVSRLAVDYTRMEKELAENRELFTGARKFVEKVLGIVIHDAPRANPNINIHTGEVKTLDQRCLELCNQGQLINAIKLHRQETGLGLKESKDHIDMLRGWKPGNPSSF